ncbi:family 16 glycoside hydrolase [Planctomycetes bacterium TBK1r]|uniref:Cytochrome c n=1 Tax=Stieleria magnilauensis TaxID=2527963 RepID=A0ABX5XPS2_9BACT|nr:Cytochrome c [Planctomycetes bacterium TBK1r]
MRQLRLILLGLLACTATFGWCEGPKYQVLFNGEDLSQWKGLAAFWSVRDGAIVGESTKENPVPTNTFLIWQGGEVSDFEFRCLVRFEGNNSGVQYRSALADEKQLALRGYQADLHPKPEYMGMMYGEKTGRGIIATGGQRVTISVDGKSDVTEALTPLGGIVTEQWNELVIVAVGNRMIHQINGVTTVDVTDHHPDAQRSGLLGLQLHQGPAMKAEYRNLLLRPLEGAEAQRVLQAAIDSTSSAKAATERGADEAAPKPNAETWLKQSPQPQWIWADKSAGNQKVWFRKSFQAASRVKNARLYATCDNRMTVFLNGKQVAKSDAWQSPIDQDVAKLLQPGRNVIAIAGQNEGGVAALVAKLTLDNSDGNSTSIVTDQTWKRSETQTDDWNAVGFDDSGWASVKTIAAIGAGPWGIPTSEGADAGGRATLRPQEIYAPAGFVVEQIYEVPKEQGSWVSLATDPQGRLYASDQGGAGLYRVTLRPGTAPTIEKVSEGQLAGVSGAQGLHWAQDSLWFHRNGGNLMRLSDSDGDDVLDVAETYPGTTGGGEHGNHAVLPMPDGKGLYLDGGNAAPLASHSRSRVPTWYEGHLLPRMWDSNGHARGRLAPGGWVTELDVASKQQVVRTIGFRNQYDIALNRHGDLFAYDADMEWDLGLPWYRPTRICLAASGADYGWRSGSGKWPTYYEDSLPPVVEIGPGSPTGMVSGLEADFPTRYRDALFACDWTFGTMYAIHLKPDGAGYRGEAEPFLYGSPLPLTDAVIGHDGALYFAVGGRGTQSGLYRVRYVGDESRERPTAIDPAAEAARKQRRSLEAFHGIVSPDALQAAWPLLSSDDRFLRHAARIAVESQPLETWAERAVLESDPQAHITATVALARMGSEYHRAGALAGLLQLPLDSLNTPQMLGMLRAYALVFERLGKPTDLESQQVIAKLDPLLPSDDDDVNTELIRVLTYLRSESVIAKSMALIENRQPTEPPQWSELASRNKGYGRTIDNMIQSMPPSREILYAFMLRNLRTGWTLDQRRSYFAFLNQAAKASGGASYAGYLTRIRDEALANCSSEQRVALQEITGEDFNPQPDFPIVEPQGPGQKWTVDAALAANRGPKNFERGRSLFFSAKCAACHRLAGLGGAIGPDLTSIPNKFDERYLVEAIIHPSKDISDQYGSSRVLTADGQVLIGLVVEKEDGDLTVYPIDENAKAVDLDADSVELIEASKVSQMPENLLDRLSAEEVRDLLTYLMTAGNPNDKRWGR